MLKAKNFLLFILLAFSVYANGQSKITDTVFILKDPELGTAQSIYCDNNRHSSFYDDIDRWHLEDFDKASYNESIENLKKSNKVFNKKKPIVPQTKWINLMQYKGKWYVYHPCDMHEYKFSFNDSTLIDWAYEGPQANIISEQKKLAPNTYEFKTAANNENRKIIIHIIDAHKHIAVFEQINNTDRQYYLMIASDQIRSVPLIVNRCDTEKQADLEFETPNFSELLKHAKK